MARTLPLHRRITGVSLIEALVALAVMSIGMLALVGVQNTMRLNSDLAKQRTEATRIASEEIERLRSFTSMAAVAGQPDISYEEIVSRVVESYQPPGGIGNTGYRVVRHVRELPTLAQKIVSVQVQWTDRSKQLQTVTLDSAISATAPTLGAMLMVPHRESPTSRSRGRHVSIPSSAVDMSDGQSRYEPPSSGGIGWYFNNLTGVMRACGVGVTDSTTCSVATFISGTVRFHLSETQPTGRDAEAPQGPARPLANGPGALVLIDAVGTGTTAACYSQVVDTLVVYGCAVRTIDASGWGGQLNVVLASGAFGGIDGFKSCRYTDDIPSAENTATVATDADPHAQFTVNADHPRKYCVERPYNTNESAPHCTGRRVNVNLIHQNFLVIKGNQRCPSELNDDGTPNGQGQDPLILANTRQHQPAP